MSPWCGWDRFWFGPISARPLGAFRVAFGLVVMADLALMAPGFDLWLTDLGPLPARAARSLATPGRPSLLSGISDPIGARAFVAGVTAVALLFTLGWRTRLMGVLLYAGLLSIHHRMIPWLTGGDGLIIASAFALMLSPCGAAYSLDARRAARLRGAEAEPILVPWAQRLIQLQVSLVYFLGALYKANGQTWLDGTALYYVLHHGEYRRSDLGLGDAPLALNLMTHGALLTEFALAFLLWVRAARPWAMAAGVALHVGIMMTVNIPIFGEMMMATYLTFLTPTELDALFRLLRRVDPRAWGRAVRLDSSGPDARIARE